MRPEGVRLSDRHRAIVYTSSTVLFVSGLLWLLFHHFVQIESPFGATPHPLEPWWLRIHGGAAMIALVVLGSLLRGHVRSGWTSRRNRFSGGLVSIIGLALVATGWGLYYLSDETARAVTSVLHWSTGLVSAGVLTLHVIAGHRTRRKRVAPVAPRRRHVHATVPRQIEEPAGVDRPTLH